jgi:hypothetical protein
MQRTCQRSVHQETRPQRIECHYSVCQSNVPRPLSILKKNEGVLVRLETAVAIHDQGARGFGKTNGKCNKQEMRVWREKIWRVAVSDAIRESGRKQITQNLRYEQMRQRR